MQQIYRLRGNAMLHPAAMLRYASHGYKTGDKAVMIDIISLGWNVPKQTTEDLLSGRIQWVETEDGAVEFNVDE